LLANSKGRIICSEFLKVQKDSEIGFVSVEESVFRQPKMSSLISILLLMFIVVVQ
jgi:hypothetical protein